MLLQYYLVSVVAIYFRACDRTVLAIFNLDYYFINAVLPRYNSSDIQPKTGGLNLHFIIRIANNTVYYFHVICCVQIANNVKF